MSLISSMIPILIPIFIIDFLLALAALIHVLKHPRYRFGNRVMWAIIVVCLLLIGPIVYFAFGRGDE